MLEVHCILIGDESRLSSMRDFKEVKGELCWHGGNKAFPADKAASAKAMRWKLTQHVLETARKTVWLGQNEGERQGGLVLQGLISEPWRSSLGG